MAKDDSNVTVLLQQEAFHCGNQVGPNHPKSSASKAFPMLPVAFKQWCPPVRLQQVVVKPRKTAACCPWLITSAHPASPPDTLVFWNGVPCNGWWVCFMAGWRVRWSACSVYWGRPPRGRARRCPPTTTITTPTPPSPTTNHHQHNTTPTTNHHQHNTNPG